MPTSGRRPLPRPAALLAAACLWALAAPACTTTERQKPKTYSGYNSAGSENVRVQSTPGPKRKYVTPMDRKVPAK